MADEPVNGYDYAYEARPTEVFRAPFEIIEDSQVCGNPQQAHLKILLDADRIKPSSTFEIPEQERCFIRKRMGGILDRVEVPCDSEEPDPRAQAERLVRYFMQEGSFRMTGQVDICLSLWDYTTLSREIAIDGRVGTTALEISVPDSALIVTYLDSRREAGSNGDSRKPPVLRIGIDCFQVAPIHENTQSAFLSLAAVFVLEERDLESCKDETCYGRTDPVTPRRYPDFLATAYEFESCRERVLAAAGGE